MTEVEWLECQDPEELLDWLFPFETDRKLRLMACAFCRLVWDTVYSVHCRNAVEAAEGLADAPHICPSQYAWIPHGTGCLNHQSDDAAINSLNWAWEQMQYHPAQQARFPGLAAGAIRDIAGNPHQPMPLRRVDWITPQVRTLATSAYTKRNTNGDLDSVCLLALADALEEAGCDYEAMLDHLRTPSSCGHFRGCWAIDWVLGKG